MDETTRAWWMKGEPLRLGMVALAAVMLVYGTSCGGGTSRAPTASPQPAASRVEGRIAFDRMSGATNPEGLYLGAFTASVDGTDENLQHPKGLVWTGEAGLVSRRKQTRREPVARPRRSRPGGDP